MMSTTTGANSSNNNQGGTEAALAAAATAATAAAKDRRIADLVEGFAEGLNGNLVGMKEEMSTEMRAAVDQKITELVEGLAKNQEEKIIKELATKDDLHAKKDAKKDKMLAELEEELKLAKGGMRSIPFNVHNAKLIACHAASSFFLDIKLILNCTHRAPSAPPAQPTIAMTVGAPRSSLLAPILPGKFANEDTI